MIDDRTLCLCGHDEFDHVQFGGHYAIGEWVYRGKCSADHGTCVCEGFQPLPHEETTDGR